MQFGPQMSSQIKAHRVAMSIAGGTVIVSVGCTALAAGLRKARPTATSGTVVGRRRHWRIALHLRRVIDLIQANAKGAELGAVLETMETHCGLIRPS